MKAFISYSTKDLALSEKLYRQIKALVSDVWIDRIAMRPGDTLEEKIREGILSSDILIVLVTQNSVKSPWVQKEIKIAIELGIAGKGPRIIPLVLRPCHVPSKLKGKLYIKISRNDLKVREIVRAIYHKEYVLFLQLTGDFELDRASLARDLGEYLTTSPVAVHVHIDNGDFNEKVLKVLAETRQHREVYIDNIDRLRQLAESLPVTLPLFWSSLALISNQLITELFQRDDRNLGTVRELTDAIEGIFEYSLNSLTFHLSNGIFPDEAVAMKEKGLAKFMVHNYCNDRRELTFKRLGRVTGYKYHAIDLIAKDGFMTSRVWAPIYDLDLLDLQPGLRVEVSPVASRWYREYLPQIIGREILINVLHGGQKLQEEDRVIGLHMDNYQKAGLG